MRTQYILGRRRFELYVHALCLYFYAVCVDMACSAWPNMEPPVIQNGSKSDSKNKPTVDYVRVFVGFRSGSITLQIVQPLAVSDLVLILHVTYHQRLQHRGREFSEMFCKRCFISASPKRFPNTWAKLVCRTALCVLPPATRLTFFQNCAPGRETHDSTLR